MLLPKIINVHGFGGRDNAPPMYVALSKALGHQQLRANLHSFAWDSLPLNPEKMVHSFLESQQRVEEAGIDLLERLYALEATHTPYTLVGFSLGAAVIRQALAQSERVLTHLRGVYLLGAAFNHTLSLNERVIPTTARCHNYYSPVDDWTLAIPYYQVNGQKAAGRVGLTQSDRFVNLQTQCSHVALFNYTVLADAIVSLIAWDAGQRQAKRERQAGVAIPTLGGKTFWNEICRLPGIVVQQNLYSGHYRAIDAAPPYRNHARGWSLHSILHLLEA